MIDVLEILRETMEGRTDDWSEADRETGKAVAIDLAKMQGKLTVGGDVDPAELEIAKASARNLAAAAAFTGANAIMEVLEKIAGKALALLNPAA